MKKSEPKLILNLQVDSEELDQKVKLAMDKYIEDVIVGNLDDEIEKLTPIHSDEEYQELLDKVYDLEKENEDLQDENNALDLQNDELREEIEKLEDTLHEIE